MDIFDTKQIWKVAEKQHLTYKNGQPVPHIALDNILNPIVLQQALDYFPDPDDPVWYKYNNVLERKLATNRLIELPNIFSRIFQELNSHQFLTFLEKLTGIEALIPDAHLNGGGLHCILPGGKLDIHADYNYHPITKLDRRLNVLVYLNHHWKEEYYGFMELWDAKHTHAVQKYQPIFNRTIIFNVSDTAFHGHPDPLLCPSGMSRKALATYYYTNGRPSTEKSEPHSTIYVPRPCDPVDEETNALRAKRSKGRLSS